MSSSVIDVLSIAGYDPCGGAGVLADVRVFQAHDVRGQAVCSSITYQNEDEFKRVEWIESAKILEQMELLFKKTFFSVAKIGLVENLRVLGVIIESLYKHNPEIMIVWDPILKASTGFEFDHKLSKKLLKSILSKCYLITPNFNEIRSLAKVLLGDADFNVAKNDKESMLSCFYGYCSVLLKGGHIEEDQCVDYLYIKENYITDYIAFSDTRILGVEKHGSGCVLSSAIAGNLAKGIELSEACGIARKYMQFYMNSCDGLLGKY